MPQLFGRDPSRQDREASIGQPWLFLRLDADVIAVPASGQCLGDGRCELVSQAPLDFIEEALGRPSVCDEEEFHACLRAIESQLIGVAEDAHDCLDHLGELRRRDEGRQQHGEVRARRESAAHPDVKAHLVTATHRRRAHVVDFRIRAPVRAAGDRDLEFARQIGVIGIAVQASIDGERDWRRIDQFVGVHTG